MVSYSGEKAHKQKQGNCHCPVGHLGTNENVLSNDYTVQRQRDKTKCNIQTTSIIYQCV